MNDVPAAVRTALAAALPAAVEDVARAVADAVPGIGTVPQPDLGTGVRRGVELALGRFLAAPMSSDRALTDDERLAYEELGRRQVHLGRPLDVLLAAYRVGARVAFDRFAAVALAAGLPAEGLAQLAGTTFAYIDQLSAASTAGWADEQGRRAGERDRRRQELLDALLSGAADPVAVRAEADAAGWPLPDSLVLVAVRSAAAGNLAARLGSAALAGTRGEHGLALVPADSAALRRVGDLPVAVSPPTAPADLAAALRPTLLALRLTGDGRPVQVAERLADLVLLRDPALLTALAARRLAPLDAARPGARDRLAETLLSWLAHRGSRAAVAEDLHLHPQTIAYRLGRLRELFGADLEDPVARFELELALRGQALLRRAG